MQTDSYTFFCSLRLLQIFAIMGMFLAKLLSLIFVGLCSISRQIITSSHTQLPNTMVIFFFNCQMILCVRCGKLHDYIIGLVADQGCYCEGCMYHMEHMDMEHMRWWLWGTFRCSSLHKAYLRMFGLVRNRDVQWSVCLIIYTGFVLQGKGLGARYSDLIHLIHGYKRSWHYVLFQRMRHWRSGRVYMLRCIILLVAVECGI